MKFALLFTFLISSHVCAQGICDYQETWEFTRSLEQSGSKPFKVSRNHKRFTFIEKEMVHLAVSLQEYLKGVSRIEALASFSESGEIVYFSLHGKRYALVRYWPGENEFGGFFELKNKAYRLIARVTDSFIDCH